MLQLSSSSMHLGACFGADQIAFATLRAKGPINVLRIDDHSVTPAAALVTAQSAIVGHGAVRTARWNGASTFVRWDPHTVAARTPVAAVGFDEALMAADVALLLIRKGIAAAQRDWAGPIALRVVSRDEDLLSHGLYVKPALLECGLFEEVHGVRETECVWAACRRLDADAVRGRLTVASFRTDGLDIYGFTEGGCRDLRRADRSESLSQKRALGALAALVGPKASLDPVPNLWNDVADSLQAWMKGARETTVDLAVDDENGYRTLRFSGAAFEYGLRSWCAEVIELLLKVVHEDRPKTVVLVGELARLVEVVLTGRLAEAGIRTVSVAAESFLATGALALEDSELGPASAVASARSPFALSVVLGGDNGSSSSAVIAAGTAFPAHGRGALLGSRHARAERLATFAIGTGSASVPLYEVAFGPIPPSAAQEKLEVSVIWEFGRAPQFSARLVDTNMAVSVSRCVEYVEGRKHRLAADEVARFAVY